MCSKVSFKAVQEFWNQFFFQKNLNVDLPDEANSRSLSLWIQRLVVCKLKTGIQIILNKQIQGVYISFRI